MTTPKRARAWNLDARETLLCTVAGLFILLSAGFAYTEVRRAMTAVGWVQHTFTVLIQAHTIDQALTDSERHLRDFLLTRNPRYLEQHLGSVAAVTPAIAEARRFTTDNERTQERLARLAEMVDAKLADLSRVREVARAQGEEAALAILRSDASLEATESARALLAAIRLQEDALLHERLVDRNEHLRGAAVASIALGSLSLLIATALVVSLNRSLGQRLAAERNARESAERLRVTLGSIGDAVIATDLAGRVVFLNPVAEALTGWRDAEASGLPLDHVFRILNEFTRETVESPVAKVLREGGIVGLANHTVLVARDGSERPIDDSGAPIRDGDGELMGVVLVFRDVTARRLSEQARERLLRAEASRDAAEAASRAKDEFLAIVSHELRSPLAAATSWLDLLRSGTLGEADRKRAIETVGRNLRLQSLVVNDLLDVSRIIAGKLTIERVACDVGAIVQRVVEDWRGPAESREVALHHEVGGPLITMVDSARFEQVLSNLLSNAIRYTPDGGRIEVKLGAAAGHVELAVSDTGQGIPAAFLPHVFERFRQAESGIVRDHGGLGLGLAIAKHVVEQHGGTIHAESDGEGRGSRFRVRIPLADVPAEGRLRGRGGAAALAGVTVLLVEDHADTREAMAHRLRSEGARVSAAATVDEALHLYDSERPDVVVSDLGLPQASGLDLIRTLRARDAERGVRTPAIAVSGYTEERRKAIDAGFDDLVSKPIELADLVDHIVALLANSR